MNDINDIKVFSNGMKYRWTMRCVRTFEKSTGLNYFVSVRHAAIEGMFSFTAMQGFIYAGLIEHNPEISFDDCGPLVLTDQHLVYEAMNDMDGVKAPAEDVAPVGKPKAAKTRTRKTTR